MAATDVDLGFGTTITFATGFLAKITGVSWGGIAREPKETSHMGTTNGWRTFIPSDLKDPGELTVELQFDKNAATKTNLDGDPETITVTFPIPAGGTTAATWACEGFLTSFELSDPMDDVMTASAGIKFTGEPTFTDGT